MTLKCGWCGETLTGSIVEHERRATACKDAHDAGLVGSPIPATFAPRGTESRQTDLTSRRRRRRIQ